MTNTHSLTCSQCGGQIQLLKGRTRIKCSYCGTEQVLTGEVAQQVQMEGAHICPVCNKDDKLEKVSAIVARESIGSQLRSMLSISEPDRYDYKAPPRPPVRRNSNPQQRPPQNDTPPAQYVEEFMAGNYKDFSTAWVLLGGAVFYCLCAILIWNLAVDFSAADYISMFLFIGVLIFAVMLGVGFYYRKLNPNFWNILLPSIVLCSFASFSLYASFFPDGFDFWMFIIAVGVGGVGLRYFVELFKCFSQDKEAVSLMPVAQAESVELRLPTYEEELTQYQSDLKAYERWKAIIKEKENFQKLQRQVWSELYYCYRDGVVILPHEGYYVEAQDMETFVNIQANRRSKESK